MIKQYLFSMTLALSAKSAMACASPPLYAALEDTKRVLDAVAREASLDPESGYGAIIRTVTRLDRLHYIVTIDTPATDSKPATEVVKSVTLKDPPPPPPGMPVPAGCGGPTTVLDSIR